MSISQRSGGVRPGHVVVLMDGLESRLLMAGDFTLQILHASDLEAGVPALDDAPRFSAIVNGLKNDYANTVILSSGDNWIPGPFYTAGLDPAMSSLFPPAKGRGDMSVLNSIGFQAATFGNHEFDEGTGAIAGIIKSSGTYPGARFPYLSSNLNFSANSDLSGQLVADGLEVSTLANKIAKSAVVTVNGEKIGLVGITTPLLPTISSPGTVTATPTGASEPLTSANLAALAAAAQPVIDALTATGINKIVVLSHLQNLNNEIALAPYLKDVDVIIGGGSHSILADSTDRLRAGHSAYGVYPLSVATKRSDNSGMTTFIVNTDGNYRYVGRLVATFNAAGDVIPGSIDANVSGAYATDAQGGTEALAADAAAVPSPDVIAVTDALRAVISAKDGNVFGKTAVYLNGERAGVRVEETNFGNLSADANLWYARQFDSSVVLSLKNGGGIRDAIGEIEPATGRKIPPQANAFKGAGEISQLDIENSLRFNNTLSLVSLTPAQLKALMEHGVAASGQQGRYPQIGGFSFAYDATRAVGDRVRTLAIKDAQGNTLDLVVQNGQIVGDPSRTFRMVTLNFLASGGDGYPFPTSGINRIDLTPVGTPMSFGAVGGEQLALAQYLAANFATTPFNQADQPVGKDGRIQNLAARSNTVGTPTPLATIQLAPVGTAKAAVTKFDAASAEINAFDPVTKRLFVTNNYARTIDIFDASNPAHPTYLKSVVVGAVNSVAVKNGVVAVAVDGDRSPQHPGNVLFLNTDGKLLQRIFVGAIPDMVTFTPDGKYLLVADEGEPSTDLSSDPEGAVHIIPLMAGVGNINPNAVKVATFGFLNGIKDQLIKQGIRLYEPWKTVAQDLEPEYIAVSPDSRTAYVTLQENNAMAVIDIASARVLKLVPLGYKAYSTRLETFTFKNLPLLGTTAAGDKINLGGFSGLCFEGINPKNGNLMFITHGDRGPNPEPTGGKRPFALPNYQARLVRFEVNRTTGEIILGKQILLTREDGVTPITGISNTTTGTAGLAYVDEVPIDLFGNTLPVDPYGADLEGIVRVEDGSFWLCDEYRPALYHFSASGRLIERLVPQGTAAAAGEPAGYFGNEVIPAVFAQRRSNRGFEAIAYQNGKIYAFIQSPIDNPDNASDSASKASRIDRILEIDPTTYASRQFAYVNEGAPADKIGDAVSIGNGEFLVVERDDATGATANKKVFRVNINGATNLTGFVPSGAFAGKTIEQIAPADLAAAGIAPASKTLHVDLIAAGYNAVAKTEGLALIDAQTIAVINDNDFQIQGTFDPATGRLTPHPNPESEVLGIITVPSALDASDRDNKINIASTNVPLYGMYQPDAIAAYEVNGRTYLVMANEGDAREYDALNELSRVKDLKLDPTKFPNATDLKKDANLGRLRVTNKLGDTDNDGDFDALYTFGGRSFSIRDADGSLVFDSGADFERIIAEYAPAYFNASNTNNTFDDRSDDKGPEPEALAIGQIDGKTYAFIGMERVGGIFVYDISDPQGARFVQYINNRDFTVDPASAGAGDIGLEGLTFVPGAQSPTGKPLLIASNEVGGTVSIYEVSLLGVQAPTTAAAVGFSNVILNSENAATLVDAARGLSPIALPPSLFSSQAVTVDRNEILGRDTATVY